ncbi:MAG TPA: AraC family transcriptional regulator [Kofleriaceae bacterium]|nr:AraC family transcriptional regulator [Kofleriaceae bacterium]
MKREWTRYYCDREPGGLEVLHARFVEHRFARHSHDDFVIGLVEAGVQAYRYRGARHVTPAGQIFLVNPGEPHTGEPAAPGGYVYRTMYPGPALMERVSVEAGGRRTVPLFTAAVVRDDALARRLADFHRAVAGAGSRLERETLLVAALGHLISRHADGRSGARRPGRERRATRRAREHIDARFDSDISLSELGALVGLSPFHLARAFHHEVGLPPHVYLDTVRIRRAREMLARSVPIAAVATAVGYADQSHLTRRFKRHLGITPGQYARERRPPDSSARPGGPGDAPGDTMPSP